MLIAYGQTGTGKTHTIFGKSESTLNKDAEDEWGLFPKTVSSTLKLMETKTNIKWKLLIQAVEFYSFQCVDLLDNKSVVQVCETGIRVSKHVQIKSVDDLIGVMDTVYKHRTATATKMNVANSGHTGSSRSHAALILTLH